MAVDSVDMHVLVTKYAEALMKAFQGSRNPTPKSKNTHHTSFLSLLETTKPSIEVVPVP
jgi:hypothetical protein